MTRVLKGIGLIAMLIFILTSMGYFIGDQLPGRHHDAHTEEVIPNEVMPTPTPPPTPEQPIRCLRVVVPATEGTGGVRVADDFHLRWAMLCGQFYDAEVNG